MGDIGTHAFNLAEFITGLKATELCGELATFVPGRLLDDDGAALVRYEGGAKGVLMASQIAIGHENSLRIRVYGEKGSLEWAQEEPNTLIMRWPDAPTQLLRTSNGYLSSAAAVNSRTPAGHPEGYLEAFANLYRHFASALQAIAVGETPAEVDLDFPSVDEGVRGMRFIDAIVSTNDTDKKWIRIED